MKKINWLYDSLTLEPLWKPNANLYFWKPGAIQPYLLCISNKIYLIFRLDKLCLWVQGARGLQIQDLFNLQLKRLNSFWFVLSKSFIIKIKLWIKNIYFLDYFPQYLCQEIRRWLTNSFSFFLPFVLLFKSYSILNFFSFFFVTLFIG